MNPENPTQLFLLERMRLFTQEWVARRQAQWYPLTAWTSPKTMAMGELTAAAGFFPTLRAQQTDHVVLRFDTAVSFDQIHSRIVHLHPPDPAAFPPDDPDDQEAALIATKAVLNNIPFVVLHLGKRKLPMDSAILYALSGMNPREGLAIIQNSSRSSLAISS